MINGNSAVSAWTNVGPDLYGENNHSGKRYVSSWFPRHEEPMEKQQNNSVFIDQNSGNKGTNNDAFTYSIIRVFAGQPQRHAPTIKDQKNGQSMLDFLGRGLNAQGPAMNSDPVPHRPFQSSQNQGSVFDFLGNPFGKPSSSTSPKNSENQTRPKCLYV